MVGEAMSAQAALEAVGEWFATAKLAGLELPNGWFGRPYGNLHQLTWAQARGDKLLLELDGQLHLLVTKPSIVETDRACLRIGYFEQAVFDWQEYGGVRTPHADIFDGGWITFHAQGGGLDW
jgi:hypothetical protein